jgi:hypothetical protein
MHVRTWHNLPTTTHSCAALYLYNMQLVLRNYYGISRRSYCPRQRVKTPIPEEVITRDTSFQQQFLKKLFPETWRSNTDSWRSYYPRHVIPTPIPQVLPETRHSNTNSSRSYYPRHGVPSPFLEEIITRDTSFRHQFLKKLLPETWRCTIVRLIWKVKK